MYRFVCFVLLAAVVTVSWGTTIERAESPISGQYIVVLNSFESIQPSTTSLRAQRDQVESTAIELAQTYRGQMGTIYTDSLQGFSARLSRQQAFALATDPRVERVVEDSWVQAASQNTQIDPPSWGLDRIDQRENQLDGLYHHLSHAGDVPVHVYVLDSGIRSTHIDFEGRVDTLNALDAINDGHGVEGCHGHGTHVAGIIGGRDHGVAKTVTLHPVRVLNCSNAGPLSAIIAGVDWVTVRVNDQPHAAVANMSLIAGASTLLDNAVRASVAAGVTYVVAAGNFATDACNYSPARVAEVITVGSSTAQDHRAPSSNHGHCVDIYAPGAGIVSTFNRNDSDSVSMSGTSMAAPHVAGIAAMLLAQAPDLSPAELADLILGYASVLDHDLDPTGNRSLAYGLIELGDETVPKPEVEVRIESLCQPRARLCSFTVSINGHDETVSRYVWDMGDSTILESQRPTVRHRYVNASGSVNIVLGVLFADGHHEIVNQWFKLPF